MMINGSQLLEEELQEEELQEFQDEEFQEFQEEELQEFQEEEQQYNVYNLNSTLVQSTSTYLSTPLDDLPVLDVCCLFIFAVFVFFLFNIFNGGDNNVRFN